MITVALCLAAPLIAGCAPPPKPDDSLYSYMARQPNSRTAFALGALPFTPSPTLPPDFGGGVDPAAVINVRAFDPVRGWMIFTEDRLTDGRCVAVEYMAPNKARPPVLRRVIGVATQCRRPGNGDRP